MRGAVVRRARSRIAIRTRSGHWRCGCRWLRTYCCPCTSPCR